MTLSVRHFMACMALVAALFSGTALAAGIPGTGKAAKQPPASVAEPRDAQDVDAFMASLSDVQARKLLHDKLTAQTAREKPDGGDAQDGGALAKLFLGWESRVRSGYARQEELLDKARQDLSGGAIMANLTGGGGVQEFARSFLLLAAVCAGAFAAAAGAGRLCDSVMRRASQGLGAPNFGRAGVILSNVALRLLGVVLFFLTAFVLFVVFVPASGPTRAMGVIVLVSLSYGLLIQAFARILLSPGHEAARPIPMRDEDARTLYRWLMGVTAASVAVAAASIILKQVGQAQALGHLVYAQAGPLVGLILCAMILANRERVAAMIRGGCGHASGGARALTARYWHYPAMFYSLCIGFFWSAQAISGEATILLLVLSLFLIPGCIGVDMWMGKLLTVASGQDREIIHIDQEHAAPQAGGDPCQDKRAFRYYIPLIRKTMRVVLVVFTAFAMLKTWGVEIPLGWLFARNVLSVLMVAVGALLLWEVIRIRIDRKLSEESSMPGEEAEEGGGAGGSRSATLLMLLRKFLLCVIVVMGSLIALSSMGVDIGPLIAGAGVVGLAIGFGAQTLVKDIISGVFFLVDDAFRVGDYVEAGTAKGTVEQISLRSMKLRHPRGMVFTIPYGGLKILQNYSRDYIISKLDFRVRYDADIEKIRKIIKRINKELMANEEISKGMLSDIKSMGVRKMEDSAMILRIKFKTIPGHQFLVEKELYRRVQQAFMDNGIEFAHRNVTVYLPPELRSLAAGEKQLDGAAQQAIGAAAAEVLAEEEERLEALAAKKKPKDE
ncbi:mechanosensitive ion channel family protein [Fundidesulfovibrio putealis]|uniref:mechanosensitive ion channel family protein n=1 Tax=Fundidesulfovibrio putealis TaxID=270496 RepID=UPI0003F97679|nr:mechanosensitive ion channel family protein [Fundidesulfovibrio putealis]